MTTLRLHHQAMAIATAFEAVLTRALARVVEWVARSGRRLDDLMRPFRLRTPPNALEWAASIASALLGLATPLAAYLVFDRALVMATAEEGLRFATACLLAAAAAAVADTCVKVLRAAASDRLARSRQAILAAREAAEVVAQLPRDTAGEGAPHRIAQLEAVAAFDDLESGALRRAILEIPALLVSLAAVAWFGGLVALAPLALILAMAALFAGESGAPARLMRAREAHDARSDDFIAECAVNLHAIKASAMEPFMTRRMESLLVSGRQLERRLMDSGVQADDMRALIEAASVLAVAAVGGLLALQGRMEVGALVACALLAVGIVRPATRLASAAQRARALRPDRPEPEASVASYAPRQTLTSGTLDVNATLRAGMAPIRFQAAHGAIIAITARDGDLMSAVMRMLAGLEDPAAGEVTLAKAPVRALRTLHPGTIALVSQRAALFSGTILENLTLFGHGATESEALAACNVLGLRREIDRLPARLDTRVGLGAADCISDSLAHRLCIARAIALRPRLLLLDEPQARVDANADRALVAGVGALRGQMTVIMSTSRPSYQSLADQIYAFDEDEFGAMAGAGR